MSKGTKRFAFRLPPSLIDEMEETISRRNHNAPGEPWTFSDFVRIACREKVAKMERSRGGRRKFPAGPVERWKEPQTQKVKTPDEDEDQGFDHACWSEG